MDREQLTREMLGDIAVAYRYMKLGAALAAGCVVGWVLGSVIVFLIL